MGMAMDDRHTVALIGGGHAFGRTHGACDDRETSQPAGLSPEAAVANLTFPYVGKCPPSDGQIGKGKSTWTSGFEGPWTTDPNKWDNEYFKYLLKPWELHIGAGGHQQWRLVGAD